MNYYEILELSRTASRDEVKAAYKKMAAVVHPDKGGSAMLFRLVQEAYEVLSDPVKRKQYDSDLEGPSGGNRQAGTQNRQQQHQQQQRQTSQSELNDIRVEEFYKRWKGNIARDFWWSNRKAMPREESYAAGGVRKMIRESSPIFSVDINQFCGTCGISPDFVREKGVHWEQSPLWLANPHRFCGNCGIHTPSRVCHRCNQARGVLRQIKLNHNENCWLKEKVEIETGDLLWYTHRPDPRWPNQAVFGYVVKGRAFYYESLLEGMFTLSVLDEFSGNLLGVSDWGFVMGHWKSNDFSRSRTGSMRNWSFAEGNRVND